MVFPQVIAVFHALWDAIGLPGNLLVIVTVLLESRFHVIRYILLASLAVSDFLFLILVNSFRILSIAKEKWLYDQTMCHLNACFARYFCFNTLLHLMAVSYDRYKAIVKSPLTYDGMITKPRVLFIVFIWVIPIPLSIAPFFGFATEYGLNPEVFFCQQGWMVASGLTGWYMVACILFVVPFLMIVFLNWSVYKTAQGQANAAVFELGTIDGCENQQQEMARRRSERRATVDVSIIIAAFVMSYLPHFVIGFLRQFNVKVPAELVLVTACIFTFSALCNPIVYSIRKREFRDGVKSLFRRTGLFWRDHNR